MSLLVPVSLGGSMSKKDSKTDDENARGTGKRRIPEHG
jgi:hypothetical protein